MVVITREITIISTTDKHRKNEYCQSESGTSDVTNDKTIIDSCRPPVWRKLLNHPRIKTSTQRTLISAVNMSAIFFRWSFCAAVTSPFSGVHSSAVKITACRISIGLNPFFLPIELHSFRTSSFTLSLWHKTDKGPSASTPKDPV